MSHFDREKEIETEYEMMLADIKIMYHVGKSPFGLRWMR
jgi:hypothetical protein